MSACTVVLDSSIGQYWTVVLDSIGQYWTVLDSSIGQYSALFRLVPTYRNSQESATEGSWMMSNNERRGQSSVTMQTWGMAVQTPM